MLSFRHKPLVVLFAGVLLLATAGLAFGQEFRTEHDLLGEMQIPADAYYGVQAARAMENFQISGVPVSRYPELVNALTLVKLAAARANHQAGALEKDVLDGIELACAAIMEGNYHDQFAVDLYQGGAGTSTNMCANEVIANVAPRRWVTRWAATTSSNPTTT